MNSQRYYELRTEFDERYQLDPAPINQAAEVADVLSRQGETDERLERQVME